MRTCFEVRRYLVIGLGLLALAVAGALPVIAAGPPSHDDITNARVIGSLPGGDIFSIEDATLALDDPDASCDVIGPSRTVWYRYTPAANQVARFNATVNGTLLRYLAVFSGAPGSLTEVACAHSQASTSLSVALTGGVTYYLLVAAADGSSYEITLYGEPLAAAANDDLDGATAIGSLPFNAPVADNGSVAPDDPPGCGYLANTLWFRYTAPGSGLVQFDLRDGLPWEIETASITVWSGARGSLVFRDCGAGTGGLPVTFPASAGETYHIMVAGFFGSATFHAESIELPANDSLTSARLLGPLPFEHSVFIQGATADPGDPAPACASPPNQTVWYRYTAANAQPLHLDAIAPDKAVIGVWSGTPGSLTPVACAQGVDPSLRFDPTPGQTYYVMLGGSDVLGSLILHAWTPVEGPPVVCPAHYELETVWEGVLLSKRTPVVVRDFALSDYTRGVLVAWSAAGHPEAGCPLGSSYLCALPDQAHEQFRIFLNTVEVGFMPDQGNHVWGRVPDIVLGILPAQGYTVTLRWEGPAGVDESVGYRVGLCLAPAPRPTEEPTEPTEEPTEPPPTGEPTEQPTEPTEEPTWLTEEPTQPTEPPTQPPSGVCPAGYTQTAQWVNTLILNSSPRVDQSFAAPGGKTILLVVASRVGHPEAGCPGGSDPLCRLPDQTNEQFHVYLEGSEVAFIPDHGDHNWQTFPAVSLGALGGGTHVLTFQHEGPADGFPDSSVTFQAAVCTEN